MAGRSRRGWLADSMKVWSGVLNHMRGGLVRELGHSWWSEGCKWMWGQPLRGGSMWEVVRENRPQVDGDHGTGENAETGDDGRDGCKVLGNSEEAKGDEGKAGRGAVQAEEADEAVGGTTALAEQVEKGWEGSGAGSAADGEGEGHGAG